MLLVDPTKFRTPAFKHQIEGVQFAISRQYGGILDQMGSGKSKQIVDAACVLFQARQITDIVIACPAGVKRVWLNLKIGEVAKHVWVDSIINEWDTNSEVLQRRPGKLTWTVVSYECLRNDYNVRRLKAQLKGYRTMVVGDESIRLKGHKSQQTIGSLSLRRACERAYILNGTPVSNGPLDLYCQMEFLSPTILRCDSFYQFRNRHAIIQKVQTRGGNKAFPTIVGYARLDILKAQIKPHVIRRLKKHCTDLPPKIYHTREVKFTEEAWRKYREMRDQMIVQLSDGDAVVARQAIVKLIRLRQMTCGFVTGADSGVTHEIGTEKMEAVMEWVDETVEQDPTAAIIIWSFFRFELERYYQALRNKYYTVRVHGGQNEADRNIAIDSFNVDNVDAPKDKPIILLGNQQAGGLGLNLTRSHNVAYSSNDYNLVNRLQSEDRVDRHGQTTSPNIFDFLVTGPQDQRTIDHVVFKALKTKEDLANWTSGNWVQAIKDETPDDFDYMPF